MNAVIKQADLERVGSAYSSEKMLAVREMTRAAIHEIAAAVRPGMTEEEAVAMAKISKSERKRTPKSVLMLPDLEQSKSAVLNSLSHSPHWPRCESWSTQNRNQPEGTRIGNFRVAGNTPSFRRGKQFWLIGGDQHFKAPQRGQSANAPRPSSRLSTHSAFKISRQIYSKTAITQRFQSLG